MTMSAVKILIDQAEVVTHHEPDLSILGEGRKKPAIFPLEVFGNYLRAWLSSAANFAGAPVDYVAGSLLAASSALIGNSRRISPWEGWDEPSALWIGLVGDPSSNKSPAIDQVINIIREIEDEMAANFAHQYREWETKREVAICLYEQWKKDVAKAKKNSISVPIKPEAANIPEELTRPRILCSDTSVEKLGLLLSTYDKGLLFYRDELTGWFGSFDRYSGQDADRAFWTESYGGRSYVIDRIKHQKPIRIKNLLVSVMGSIQPDKLAKLIKGADDGFTARFLWLWADPIAPFRPNQIVDNSIAKVLHKLSELKLDNNKNGVPRILKLSEELAILFHEWRKEHYNKEQHTYGLLKSSYGKAPGHLLRLAITLELLWWAVEKEAPEPTTISAKAITAASCLIDSYFKPMAERVFGDISITEEERLASTLARYILKTKPEMINLRNIRREAHLPGLSKADKMQIAANYLAESNWLFEHSREVSIGRPRGDYIVNPRIWETARQMMKHMY